MEDRSLLNDIICFAENILIDWGNQTKLFLSA